jgi:hypothetical protein
MPHEASPLPPEMPFDLSSDEIKILVDAGFLAASRGINSKAIAIFDAVIVARPHLTAGYIGKAYTWLGINEPQKALDDLAPCPPSIEADLFRGLAHHKLGDVERATKLFQHVQKYGVDANHMAIATAMLAEIPL